MSENSNNSAFALKEPEAGVSRRGVVTAAAWAAPVIGISMATPALAASPPPVTALTLLFSKPLYTAAPGTMFAGGEAVKVTLLNKNNVPVPGATLKLDILPADDPDSDDEETSDDPDVPSEAWFTDGGSNVTSITVVTGADGSYTARVLAGAGAGTLPITAKTVALPSGVTGTAAADSLLRVTEIGEAWSWGDGGSGALGTGTTRSVRVPVGMAFPASVNSIEALYVGEHRRAFAIDDQKRVWAWGSDSDGNLFGTPSNQRYKPVDVTAKFPGVVKQIDGGYYSTYALLENGDVYGWGDSSNDAFFQRTGQTSPASDQRTPIRLNFDKNPTPLPAAIAKIAATRHNAYFLLENGEVWTWGRNYEYALGRNISSTGVTYDLGKVQGLPAGDPVIDIDARYYGATVVTASGAVYSWGSNNYGEVGDGTNTDRNQAVKVIGITGKAVRAYAAWRNAGVVMDDGSAYVWGMGDYNALGNGLTTSTVSGRGPVKQSFSSRIESLAVGYRTIHAQLENGTVMGWGRNSSGQVGDGKTATVKTPVPVIGLPGDSLLLAATQYTTYAIIQGN